MAMFRIKPGQIWSNFGGVRLGWVVDPCKPNSKPSPIEVYYWVPGWWVFPKMTSSHGWNVGDVSSSIGFTTSKIEHPLSSKYLITISGWCFWTGMGPWVPGSPPGSLGRLAAAWRWRPRRTPRRWRSSSRRAPPGTTPSMWDGPPKTRVTIRL